MTELLHDIVLSCPRVRQSEDHGSCSAGTSGVWKLAGPLQPVLMARLAPAHRRVVCVTAVARMPWGRSGQEAGVLGARLDRSGRWTGVMAGAGTPYRLGSADTELDMHVWRSPSLAPNDLL